MFCFISAQFDSKNNLNINCIIKQMNLVTTKWFVVKYTFCWR